MYTCISLYLAWTEGCRLFGCAKRRIYIFSGIKKVRQLESNSNVFKLNQLFILQCLVETTPWRYNITHQDDKHTSHVHDKNKCSIVIIYYKIRLAVDLCNEKDVVAKNIQWNTNQIFTLVSLVLEAVLASLENGLGNDTTDKNRNVGRKQ